MSTNLTTVTTESLHGLIKETEDTLQELKQELQRPPPSNHHRTTTHTCSVGRPLPLRRMAVVKELLRPHLAR